MDKIQQIHQSIMDKIQQIHQSIMDKIQQIHQSIMDKIQQIHQFKHYCLKVLEKNNNFIQQGSIKLIKSYSKNIFDVTKIECFK